MDDENSNYPTIRKRIVIVFFFSSPSFSQRKKYFRSKYLVVNREFFFTRNFWDEISLIQIKKKRKKDTRSQGEVNIPWRWKILSPNLFVYIECVVSIPRMIRTRIFVSDLGRRYSGVPARACSLYQEIYIYIYTNRKSITSSFQETEKEIEGSGRGGVDFSNREISRI